MIVIVMTHDGERDEAEQTKPVGETGRGFLVKQTRTRQHLAADNVINEAYRTKSRGTPSLNQSIPSATASPRFPNVREVLLGAVNYNYNYSPQQRTWTCWKEESGHTNYLGQDPGQHRQLLKLMN